MSDSDPVAMIEALPFKERALAALEDGFLAFAASIEGLPFDRLRARLRACGATSKAWDAAVEARRPRAEAATLPKADRWRERLKLGEGGRPVATPYNAGLILRHWAPFETLRLNELSLEAELDGEPWKDGDTFRWQGQIEHTFDVNFSRETLEMGLEAVAEERGYHPVRERVEATEWDGHERIKNVAEQILDSHDPLATRLIECFLLGACARLFNRGEKVDDIFTLYSAEQGLKKTTFFEILGYNEVYIGPFDPSNKDHVMCAATSFFLLLDECDELTGRMEWPAIKRFASMRWDTFRAPYGRRPRRFQRGFVTCATTNKNDFLRDDTGSRRWHIVSVGPGNPDIRMATLVEWRDQLWAEADAKRRAGLQSDGTPKPFLWWLTPEEEALRKEGAKAYEDRTVLDEKVVAYIARQGTNPTIRMIDLLCDGLGVERPRVAKENGLARQAGSALRKLGFEVVFDNATHTRVWRRRA